SVPREFLFCKASHSIDVVSHLCGRAFSAKDCLSTVAPTRKGCQRGLPGERELIGSFRVAHQKLAPRVALLRAVRRSIVRSLTLALLSSAGIVAPALADGGTGGTSAGGTGGADNVTGGGGTGTPGTVAGGGGGGGGGGATGGIGGASGSGAAGGPGGPSAGAAGSVGSSSASDGGGGGGGAHGFVG